MIAAVRRGDVLAVATGGLVADVIDAGAVLEGLPAPAGEPSTERVTPADWWAYNEAGAPHAAQA